MKIKALFIAMCLAANAVAAAPQFFINGSQQWERNRISRLELTLNFTREPMPSPWTITILQEGEFDYQRDRYHLDTDTAFTVMQQQHTFLNEKYLVFASDDRVQWTLAHEAGHLISESTNEDKANDVARQLVQ